MEAAFAEIGDIILDHSASDLEPAAEPMLEHVDVADPILEADHQRPGFGVGGDLRGRFGGVAALDRQRDDLGLVERFGAAAGVAVTRAKIRLPSRKIAERQAMRADVLRDFRPADERDRQACRGPGAADKAADGTGPQHRNFRPPHYSHPLPRYGCTPWSGSHRPSGGPPLSHKPSPAIPPPA